MYELPHYSGTKYEDDLSEYPQYSGDLWRRNTDTVSGSDPQVLDNTARDGYYYLYMTTTGAGFYAYRTKDFITWESVGQILAGESGWGSYWAPEVIAREDETGNVSYYMYFSAVPTEYVSADKKVVFVAKSDSPAGPFAMHDFGTANNDTDASYSRYALFDYEQMLIALNSATGENFTAENMPSIIDANPFVAENGDRYIYFSLEEPRGIIGMKMTDALTIDYSSVTLLTRVGYYTIADYERELAGETVEKNEYELMGTVPVNEGPSVIEHNGKFYLTFSVNEFYNASYSVMQAVADNPLGPYRKLNDDENGLFLSADMGSNVALSGTGHHSFFSCEGSLYICYHRHIANGSSGGGRMICVDEVKWIETDSGGEKLDVLYVNGPTITVQPRFDSLAEYVNIAQSGKVSLVAGELEEDSLPEYLTDGLLSYNTSVSQNFLNKFVRETVFKGEATFEIVFEDAAEIRGFMVYGSKFADRYFTGVYDVEITVTENNTEKIYYIEELPVDKSCVIYNEDELLEGDYIVESVVYGSSVWAEFDALKVKSIRFTVKGAEGQKQTGLSEIAVLGKRG